MNSRKIQERLSSISISFFDIKKIIKNFDDFVIGLVTFFALVSDCFRLADEDFFEALGECSSLIPGEDQLPELRCSAENYIRFAFRKRISWINVRS